MRLHTRAHAHTRTRAHTRAHTRTPMHTHARAPTHAHAHTYAHACALVHTRTRLHARTRARAPCTHTTHACETIPHNHRQPINAPKTAYTAFFACSACRCSITRRKRLKTALIALRHAQTCSHLPGPGMHRRASAMLHCTINDKPRTGRGLSGGFNKLLHRHQSNNFRHFSPVCWVCNNWNSFIPACTTAAALPVICICFAQFRICSLGI